MATPGSMGMGEMGMKPRMMGPMAPSIDPRMMGPGGMAPSMGPFAPSLPPMDPRMMSPLNPHPPDLNLISGCPLDYLVTMGTTEPQTTVPSGKKPSFR